MKYLFFILVLLGGAFTFADTPVSKQFFHVTEDTDSVELQILSVEKGSAEGYTLISLLVQNENHKTVFVVVFQRESSANAFKNLVVNSRDSNTFEFNAGHPSVVVLSNEELKKSNLEQSLPKDLIDIEKNDFSLAVIPSGIIRYKDQGKKAIYLEEPTAHKILFTDGTPANHKEEIVFIHQSDNELLLATHSGQFTILFRDSQDVDAALRILAQPQTLQVRVKSSNNGRFRYSAANVARKLDDGSLLFFDESAGKIMIPGVLREAYDFVTFEGQIVNIDFGNDSFELQQMSSTGKLKLELRGDRHISMVFENADTAKKMATILQQPSTILSFDHTIQEAVKKYFLGESPNPQIPIFDNNSPFGNNSFALIAPNLVRASNALVCEMLLSAAPPKTQESFKVLNMIEYLDWVAKNR